MSETEADLVREAIEAGRIKRIPAGVTAIVRKPKPVVPAPKFHAEHCGKGNRISRHNFLDELDGDWS